jgi:hypothetical protein
MSVSGFIVFDFDPGLRFCPTQPDLNREIS